MDDTDRIVGFGEADRHVWTCVNDDVMGGVSQGSLRRTDRGTAVFAGTLSLDNNGGFASVRAWLGHVDLSAYEGIRIRVRGDGRPYRLRLRTDNYFDGIAYQSKFETTDGTWTEIRLPFASFVPTYRGRTLLDEVQLDPGQIHQISFMIADRQAGPFQIEIDAATAYRATP